VFHPLSLLAALGIVVLFEGEAGRALAGHSADPVDVQMTPADGAQRHAVASPRAPYPAWLLLPPEAHIVNGVRFDNTPTQGGGALLIAASGDGQALVTAWETRLRAAGFTYAPDDDPRYCTFGALSGLRMEQAATGRGLTVGLDSDEIEVLFWEPYPGRP
jgi:hypothetical protein